MPQSPTPDPTEALFHAVRLFAQCLPVSDKRVKRIVFEMRDGTEIKLKVPDLPPPAPPPPPEQIAPAVHSHPRTHSIDFRSIRWNVAPYRFTFTPLQSQVVKVLWEAYENGTPELGHETVREASGAVTARIRDLFRDHPAWDTVICHGHTDGTLRLGRPNEDAAE